ncbi:hypothetical protein HK104_008647 [Borealophlyctis nickersoniae]|nr:hypothetical protein HK104_008647 [Borealophlyctis nickersoniae]
MGKRIIESESEPEEELYEVEKILTHKKSGKKLEYKVRWLGYGSDDDTWEPAENVSHCTEEIDDYWSSIGQKPPTSGAGSNSSKRKVTANKKEESDEMEDENYKVDEDQDDEDEDHEVALSDEDFEYKPVSHASSPRKTPKGSPVKQATLDSFFKIPSTANGGRASSSTTPVKSAAKPRTSAKLKSSSSSTSATVFPGGNTSKKGKIAAADAGELPPINDIGAMFMDLVQSAPDIAKVAKKLEGRKLRVATMCSGTESPLLALELISRAIKELYGISFEVEHVFSCEIEPFKQAYIERNFAPPILFRDVCELGGDQATTAYGSLVDVPGDVDLLIAGTSCVDYSNLNNEKQDIDAGGESGRTFRGMMSWVAKHRPPLVILENVCNAPWPKVQKAFEKNKYNASFMRVDTKNYYIPHTRTRVYLFATTSKDTSMTQDWVKYVGDLARPSSSPLEAFLLPTDDPRIHQARTELARQTVDKKGGRLDWTRCESRHQRARLEENLGIKRPLTVWEDGGICKLPDYAWNDWGRTQTERVLDLMDINMLRLASKGVDPLYKTLVWNLSQNVDRTTGSVRPGICPCLTPSMIPFITNRGGPLVGLEALSLQGIPVDELLLTRESQDNLADLAGNAMTTTVVGSCMLGALILGMQTMRDGPRAEDGSIAKIKRETTVTLAGREIDGDELLDEQPLELITCTDVPLSFLLTEAARSARYCECEGRAGMTTEKIQKCQDCNSTSCTKCGGRPEHNYQIHEPSRILPSAFEKELKGTLPMRLAVQGITKELLEQCREDSAADVDDKSWSLWRDAALDAIPGAEFRFRMLKRQEVWTVSYDSPKANMELLMDPVQPEWRLFVKPAESEPVNSRIRELVANPVARMILDKEGTGVLSGVWQVCLPASSTFTVTLTGCGNLVPSWEAEIGLKGDFETKMRWSEVKISDIPPEAVPFLDRDISGTYQLLPKCGTAMGALHKKQEAVTDKLPLFFFLDPTRSGEPDQDPFVFSTAIRRIAYGENRPTIARLDTKWRPSDTAKPQKVKVYVQGKWASLPHGGFADVFVSEVVKATVAMPTTPDTLNAAWTSDDACCTANALLACRVPLRQDDESLWPRGRWATIDLLHKGRATFESLAWVTERVPPLTALGSWVDAGEVDQKFNVHGTKIPSPCERCAPTEPDLRWVPVGKDLIPLEDPVQAGAYEQALKKRPAPFVVQLRLGEDGVGTLRIGLNIASLLHRALSRLPTAGRQENPRLSWRLSTDYKPGDRKPLRLTSNRADPSHAQPPHFRQFPLRPEQLRSLRWMLAQEDQNAKPFLEEEIAEAELEPLGWRAEGKAERPVFVRGGVLADEVGYGKTAITVGLIDTALSRPAPPPPPADQLKGYIPTKATLIMVPSHLIKQWPSEIGKFTGNALTVIKITNLADLNKETIKGIQNADIVVVSSSLFKSEAYWTNLAAFAAADGPLPAAANGGRHFVSRYEEALECLRERVTELSEKSDGVKLVREAIASARDRHEEAVTAAANSVVSKRLVGKKYREQEDKTLQSDNKRKAQPTDDEDDEPNKKVTKRRVGRVVVSSDEDEEPAKKAANGDSKRKATVISSDDEASELPSKKKIQKKRRVIESESEQEDADMDDDEDEDEEMEQVSRSKEVPKAKLKREDRDPWKLHTTAVKKDWKQMQCPPLEMFHFRRLVVDEFTYLGGREHAAIIKLRSTFRWVLSGTPPVHDFNAVKTIAVFLGVHLGVDDGEIVKRGRKDQTKAEKFHAFRETHSLAWHVRRHEIAQIFLDRYVRQNIAEIDEILCKEHIMRVTLPAAERAIYLELEHHLQAMEMNTKKGIKSKNAAHGDRERRLREVLGDSGSAEEALLKRCSHFDLHHEKTKTDARSACEVIVAERTRQLNACKDDLVKYVSKAQVCYKIINRMGGYDDPDQDMFARWQRGIQNEGVGDREATDMLIDILRLAGCLGKAKNQEGDEELVSKSPGKLKKHLDLDADFFTKGHKVSSPVAKGKGKAKVEDAKGKGKAKETIEGKGKAKAKPKGKGKAKKSEEDGDEDEGEKSDSDDEHKDMKLADRQWYLRERVHALRKLAKELVGRVRSLRYFTAVRDLQKSKNINEISVTCPGMSCEGKTAKLPAEQVAVLSCCGHMGCLSCLSQHADQQECPAEGCDAQARPTSVVVAKTLGVEDTGRSGKFGIKIAEVVKLIKSIDVSERILIFVQFADLMEKVGEALTDARIGYLQVKGTAHQKSTALQKFQQEHVNKDERVLLLNVMDESASGANLTTANHAIFLSPLLTPTQEVYTACETQAIGRVRRYGQTRLVHIYRFLSEDTMDTQIFEQRIRAVI